MAVETLCGFTVESLQEETGGITVVLRRKWQSTMSMSVWAARDLSGQMPSEQILGDEKYINPGSKKIHPYNHLLSYD